MDGLVKSAYAFDYKRKNLLNFEFLCSECRRIVRHKKTGARIEFKSTIHLFHAAYACMLLMVIENWQRVNRIHRGLDLDLLWECNDSQTDDAFGPAFGYSLVISYNGFLKSEAQQYLTELL